MMHVEAVWWLAGLLTEVEATCWYCCTNGWSNDACRGCVMIGSTIHRGRGYVLVLRSAGRIPGLMSNFAAVSTASRGCHVEGGFASVLVRDVLHQSVDTGAFNLRETHGKLTHHVHYNLNNWQNTEKFRT